MKILVVGSGAVGGYFGGVLSRRGQDVTLLARGEHLEAIKTRGLDYSLKHRELTRCVVVEMFFMARRGDPVVDELCRPR